MAALKFELEMAIEQCIIHCSVPGLSVPVTVYVETSIGGILCENGRTELSKMVDGHVVWNKRITTHFTDLEPSIPIIISLSLYRKRVFQQGFKLIGTAHLYVTDLIPMLDKGTVVSRLGVNMTKHIPATGSLLVSSKIKTVLAKSNPVYTISPLADSYVVDIESREEHSEHLVNLKASPKSLQRGAAQAPSGLVLYMGYINIFLVVLFLALVMCATYEMIAP